MLSRGPWDRSGQARTTKSSICQGPLENHTKLDIEPELQHHAAAACM
jgi:hypothetical protein